MKKLLGIILFLFASTIFAQRLALNKAKNQKISPWPICQHFDAQENHFDYICRDGETKNQPKPIQEKNLESIKNITYEVKKNELLNEIKELALDATQAQINKIQSYLQCLDTKKDLREVTLKQSTGSASLKCKKIRFELISEVNDDLPKYRIFSALRGNSKYKHLYNSELNFGRNRDEASLIHHKKRLNEIYVNPPLSEGQMNIYLESSELFATVPKHEIKSKETPHIPLTPKEVQLSLYTYKETKAEESRSVHDKEQEWLAQNFTNNSAPFNECAIKISNNPPLYRFPSYHLKQEEALAKKCGNDYFKTPEASGVLGLGDLTGELYSIRRKSAYHSFLSHSNPLRTSHGTNSGIHKNWDKNYKDILSANPYFGYLQLTSEDLLDESDFENDELANKKIQNITDKLYASFQKLLESVQAAKKKIKAKNNLREFTSLKALIPKYLESKDPLYKSDCDVLAREHRISKRNQAIVDGSLIGLSIVGAISCPFTFGIGCVVTVGSETTNIARTQNQAYSTKNQFLAGNATLDQYLEARNKANQTIALAPLSVVGLPVLSSSAKGTKLFASIGKYGQNLLAKPARQLQAARPASIAKKVVDEFPVKETRSKFFNNAEAIEHVRSITSINDQLKFLIKEIPEADPQQLRYLLEQAKEKNIRVVFGGSRIRGAGQYKATSDLDVGFHSTERGTRNLEKVVQKVVKEANKKEVFPNGLKIEDGVKIYTKNKTPTISSIESPEEFFMRSGVRLEPDPKAGQAFQPSGYLSISPDGEVIRGIPVKP